MVRRELAILYILYYCTYNVLHCAKATQQRPLLFFWHELSLPPGISGFITGAKGLRCRKRKRYPSKYRDAPINCVRDSPQVVSRRTSRFPKSDISWGITEATNKTPFRKARAILSYGASVGER